MTKHGKKECTNRNSERCYGHNKRVCKTSCADHARKVGIAHFTILGASGTGEFRRSSPTLVRSFRYSLVLWSVPTNLMHAAPYRSFYNTTVNTVTMTRIRQFLVCGSVGPKQKCITSSMKTSCVTHLSWPHVQLRLTDVCQRNSQMRNIYAHAYPDRQIMTMNADRLHHL